MPLAEPVRARLREALFRGRPELRLLAMLLRPRQQRSTEAVRAEYTASWAMHRRHLDACRTLDEWLFVPGFEDRAKYYNLDGRMRRAVFNSGGFFLRTLARTIRARFPGVQSITEYGAGMGRNLLYLKRAFPDVAMYGYELCEEGVETGRLAARKFALPVSYAQLDFVKSPPAAYVFPPSELGFTMFALEQVPDGAEVALRHIHEHCARGSIHLEPVVENYPWSYPGVLGRLYHRQIDYLRGFDAIAHRALIPLVDHQLLTTSHNPVVYPSCYVFAR